MNKLPSEILHHIFTLLDVKDRVNCMTVCTAWEAIIKETNLFETINLSTIKQFNNLSTLMIKSEKVGLQTNRLLLDLCGFPPVQLQQFVDVFPQIRTLYITNLVDDQDMMDPRFQPWRDNLEVVIEENYTFTKRLLQSGTCSSLNKLFFRGLISQHMQFVRALKNTPHLQSLELANIGVTLQDLDTLHSTVPLLKRLGLSVLAILEGVYPANIVPASNITSVSFEISRSNPEPHQILRYVSEKYVNLIEFSLNDRFVRNRGWGRDSEMFNSETYSYYFEKVAARLKSLDVTLAVAPTPFAELLDNANCQIQKLTIGPISSIQVPRKLSSSRQTEYIQSLTMTNMEFGDYSFLKGFLHLKELRLSSKDKNIQHITQQETNLNTLLSINSLELLELEDFNLSCTVSSRVYSLKHLALKRVTLPTKLDKFLSKSCPRLHHLQLFNCRLRDIKSGQFNLFHHKLSYLGIRDHFKPTKDYVLLVTDNEQRYSIYVPQVYDVNRHFHLHDRAVQKYSEATPYSSMGCEPFITVQCDSVNIVMILYADPVYNLE